MHLKNSIASKRLFCRSSFTFTQQLIMSIYDVALNIKFWGPIVLFSIGVPGACLNALLFITIKTFRQSPSAFYVIGQSFADIGVLLLVLFQLIPSASVSASPIACKLTTFSVQVTSSAAMNFLCLAAFDRWACTSQSARIRQWSSIQVARSIFLMPFIIWSLVNIPFLIYVDIIPILNICWFTNDLFMRLGTLVLSPVLTTFLPLLLLIFFVSLTFLNIHFVKRIRQQPNQTHMSSWEQQMTRMMLTQTLLSIFCTIPRAIFIIYSIATVDQSATRSFFEASIILLADSLTVSIILINFASSFYIFLFSSPRFRKTIVIYVKRSLHIENNRIEPTRTTNKPPTFTRHQIAQGTTHVITTC